MSSWPSRCGRTTTIQLNLAARRLALSLIPLGRGAALRLFHLMLIPHPLADVATWILRHLSWEALMSIGDLIYDYQTLITGAAALAAAFVAARPVYRQLALMRTQSEAVLRDMLLARDADLGAAIKGVAKEVSERLSSLGSAVYWEEGDEIDEDRAYHHERNLSLAAQWLKSQYGWRDMHKAEEFRAVAIAEIDTLVDTLDAIYRPVSTEKESDDHSFTDAEWAELEAHAEAAKGEVLGKLSAAQKAVAAYVVEIANEQRAIREKLKLLDRALVTIQH